MADENIQRTAHDWQNRDTNVARGLPPERRAARQLKSDESAPELMSSLQNLGRTVMVVVLVYMGVMFVGSLLLTLVGGSEGSLPERLLNLAASAGLLTLLIVFVVWVRYDAEQSWVRIQMRRVLRLPRKAPVPKQLPPGKMQEAIQEQRPARRAPEPTTTQEEPSPIRPLPLE